MVAKFKEEKFKELETKGIIGIRIGLRDWREYFTSQRTRFYPRHCLVLN